MKSFFPILLWIGLSNSQLLDVFMNRRGSDMCMVPSESCETVETGPCSSSRVFQAYVGQLFSNECRKCLAPLTSNDNAPITLVTCQWVNTMRWTLDTGDLIRHQATTTHCIGLAGTDSDIGHGRQLILQRCNSTLKGQRWYRNLTCPPGSQSNADMNGCEPCPSGTVKNIVGPEKCISCQTGFVPNEDMTTCIDCPSNRCTWLFNSVVLAGRGWVDGGDDGVGTAATFYPPKALALDSDNSTIYISEQEAHRIRKMTANGTVTTLAGSGIAGSSDGVGTNAELNGPLGIIYHPEKKLLFFTDLDSSRLRTVDPLTGYVKTIMPSGNPVTDGPMNSRSFRQAINLAVNSQGHIILPQNTSPSLRLINLDQEIIETIAGSYQSAYVDAPGRSASFVGLHSVTIDNNGDIFVLDARSNTIRKVQFTDGSYNVTTLLRPVFSKPRQYSALNFNSVIKKLIAADRTDNTLRMITPYGVPRIIISISNVLTVVSLPSGDMYVSTSNNRILRVYTCPPYSIWIASNRICLCLPGYEKQEPNYCVPCPAGTFKNSTGNQKCEFCPAATGANSERTGCQQCQQGTFRIDRSYQNCLNCPLNATCAARTFFECNVGFQVNSDSTGCELCPMGLYKSSNDNSSCLACPVGFESSLDRKSCKPCQSGFFRLRPEKGACVSCPPNGVCSSISLQCQGGFRVGPQQITCEKCPVGWFKPSLDNSTTCSKCPVGQQNNENRTGCVSCPLGSFKPNNQQYDSCVECPDGSRCWEDKIECLAGFYPDPDSSSYKCFKCPSGQVKSQNGNFNCTACPSGSYPSEDSTICLQCNSGYFYIPSNDTCQRCPLGQEPNPLRTDCRNCILGQTYRPSDEYEFCIKCPIAATCDLTSFSCFPANEINLSSDGCSFCPEGTYKARTDNSDCQQCPIGYEPNPERTGCLRCSKNYYRSSSTFGFCVPCPYGSRCVSNGFTCEDGYRKTSSGNGCEYEKGQSDISDDEIEENDSNISTQLKISQASVLPPIPSQSNNLSFFTNPITYAFSLPIIIFLVLSVWASIRYYRQQNLYNARLSGFYPNFTLQKTKTRMMDVSTDSQIFLRHPNKSGSFSTTQLGILK